MEYTDHLNPTPTHSRYVCVCDDKLMTVVLTYISYKHVIFFFKGHIMAGQVTPAPGIEDFAWLTKQEIEQKVDAIYWENIKDMLSNF